jgi:hypothetical protein
MADKRKRRSLWSTEDREPVAPVEPQEPLDGSEAMLRITVYASVDQVEHLDKDRLRVRRASREILDRTAIIRGLIEGYRRSGLDLIEVGISTEHALAEHVAAKLRDGHE